MELVKASNFFRKSGFLPFAVLLLCYTVYRAVHLSLVYDESCTYRDYVVDSVYNILNYANPTPNNHLINTLSIKALLHWLPLSQLTLRLPNLLAHVIFLVFTWLILGDIKRIWLKIAFYLIINMQPYLLDSFSLARGYGISIAFMVMSLHYLKTYFYAKKNIPNLVAALLSGAVASLASFALVNYYLAICCIILIDSFYPIYKAGFNGKTLAKTALRTWVPVTVVSAPLLWYILHIVSILNANKQLWFGGKSGFFQDTVGSLSYLFYYTSLTYDPVKDGRTEFIFCIIASVMFIASIVLAMFFLWKKKNARGAEFLFILISAVFIIAESTEFQHLLMGTQFLSGRFAILFIPLFLLLIIYALHVFFLIDFSRWRQVCIAIISGCLIFYFGSRLNFSSFLIWKDYTKTMIADLYRYNNNNKGQHTPVVYSHWILTPSLILYSQMQNDSSCKFIYKADPDYTEDYLIYERADYEENKGRGLILVKEYPQTSFVIVKNEHRAVPALAH